MLERIGSPDTAQPFAERGTKQVIELVLPDAIHGHLPCTFCKFSTVKVSASVQLLSIFVFDDVAPHVASKELIKFPDLVAETTADFRAELLVSRIAPDEILGNAIGRGENVADMTGIASVRV